MPRETRFSECHPSEKHWARGMCKACYSKFKNSRDFVAIGRKRADIGCGHVGRRVVANGMCQTCYVAHQRRLDPEKTRRERKSEALRRAYGINIEQFEAICKAQGGMCAICEKALGPGHRSHVDHCHKTGRVRGVLCSMCNRALGMLGDDEDGISRALAYIVCGPRERGRIVGIYVPGSDAKARAE